MEVKSAPFIGVRREQSRVLIWRRLEKFHAHLDPKRSTTGGHYDDALTDLVLAVIEEGQPVWLAAEPIGLVGDDEGEVEIPHR